MTRETLEATHQAEASHAGYMAGLELPVLSAPQLVNRLLLPIAADLYFSAQKSSDSLLVPESAVAQAVRMTLSPVKVSLDESFRELSLGRALEDDYEINRDFSIKGHAAHDTDAQSFPAEFAQTPAFELGFREYKAGFETGDESPAPAATPAATPALGAAYLFLPQLPPPLSAKSSRFSLRGEEFGQMRRLLATELKTPAEYTLHIVFTQFVRHAERKLNKCLEVAAEPAVVELLVEGADVHFDTIIRLLGYIAKRKPKPVIDSVMFWRKSKSEVAAMAAVEVEKLFGKKASPARPKRSVSLMRRVSTTRHRRQRLADLRLLSLVEADDRVQQARATAVQAERKLLASIYILCRVLIEVVKQTSFQTMGDDLGGKLEEIVYTQLKTTDPVSTLELFVRLANWNLFAQLLGHMLEERFATVLDRFVADLEKVPPAVAHADEPRLHLLVHGMRYLRLTNYPLERFEESAEFVQLVTKFFAALRSATLVLAYADVLASLLLPLAARLTAEANHPLWVDATRRIYERAQQLPAWAPLVLLATAALCVSSKELFLRLWFQVLEANAAKLRAKGSTADKATLVLCLARLLWVYVTRLPDTLNNTVKRLDAVFEQLFWARRQWLVADPQLLCRAAAAVRVVGFHHFNYVLDSVLLPLLKALFELLLELAHVEKLVLVARSYTLCVRDQKLAQKPPFPDADEPDAPHDAPHYARYNKVLFDRLKNHQAHEEMCRALARLLRLVDAEVGFASSGSKPLLFSLAFGLDFAPSRSLYLDLFRALVDASVWCLVPMAADAAIGISFKEIVEVLVRNAIHEDAGVAAAASGALMMLAARRNAGLLFTIMLRVAFRITERPSPAHDPDYFHSEHYIRLIRLYAELLRCWLNQFHDVPSAPAPEPDAQLSDLYQINHKALDLTNLEPPLRKPHEELEWKTIITAIEEIEGNGLYFLSSVDSRTRLYAISILKMVEQFDELIAKITTTRDRGHARSSSNYAAEAGTRLIHVLRDADFLELLKPCKKDLSVPERLRLAKIKNKKGILLKLAASDNGIDTTVWFRVFPTLLELFFEKCPMPVAMCRLIVCVRLVEMHDFVDDISKSYRNYTPAIFSRAATTTPPEVLINQWEVFLIFACCLLTSTNEQKISFPAQPTHGRKKLLNIYIQHQKITSAKSVFRMVLPLLELPQPMIREAVIAGLGSININVFKSLTDSLPEEMNDWDFQNEVRDPVKDCVRVEIVHILSSITTRFPHLALYTDEATVANLVLLIKNVKGFLSLPFVQCSPDFQRLRCHFSTLFENVFVGLSGSASLNRWLPFEARIGCFNFLKEWCDYGDARKVLEERYHAMALKAQQRKEPAAAVAMLELERRALQMAALSTMATICSGPLKQLINAAVLSFDIRSVAGWVDEIIKLDAERVQEIGETALRNMLAANINVPELFGEVVRQCYHPANPQRVCETYFVAVVDAYIAHGQVERTPHDMVCLCLVMAGSERLAMRTAAMRGLNFVEQRFWPSAELAHYTESVCCTTLVIYKKALLAMAAKLAALHPLEAFTYISHLTWFANQVDSTRQRDILGCLLPWMQRVELKAPVGLKTVNDIEPASLMLLNNLFELTVRYGDRAMDHIEALWVALDATEGNLAVIFEYIVTNCLERKNANLVSYLRQIIAFLVFARPASPVVDKLVANLQPKAMVPALFEAQPPRDLDFFYVADVSQLLPQSKEMGFSLGQLCMVFLDDLFTTNNEALVTHLPLLLHVCFLLLDHYFPVVQEQAALLLIHLIHTVAPELPESAAAIDTLKEKNHFKHLWIYDDLNDKKGGITPKNMDLLVRNILKALSPTVPTLQEDWSRVSLKWATTCAVRHIACRSFQLFRLLLSFLDQPMLKDMLHRLSNTIADELVDIQGFAMQILMTLNAITAELSSEKLIDFPQLFWSSVACLSTVHEHEFIEIISTMLKFASKIDLSAPDTISCLIATFPPKWEGKFDGLQRLVAVGLRSAVAWEPTMKFLDKLNTLPDLEIIGRGEERLLMVLVTNFPRFLHALDQNSIAPEIEEACTTISKMASALNKPGLARILTSLAKNRFRSKKDFLVQTISTIKGSFSPEDEAEMLVLLLGLLTNQIAWVKLETLAILKHSFALIDLQREEFVGMGADLILPLLRLLLTEYAEPALEVLDEAALISGSEIDKDILRMSLSNSAMRGEYDQTATLFGIPEESGWAIPMPSLAAALTRNNVHAVYENCTEAPVSEQQNETFDDEEIQFLMEDYYAPASDHDAVSISVNESAALLSNMWAALDDFDSFFTKPQEPRKFHAHSISVDTKNSNLSDLTLPTDSVPQIYDKKALVILNRSLARTQLSTLFKNLLSDTFGLPVRHGPPETVKRLYIPFRNSKVQKKPRHMSLNGSFEELRAAQPYAHSPDSEDSRLDGLLNGRKRRTGK